MHEQQRGNLPARHPATSATLPPVTLPPCHPSPCHLCHPAILPPCCPATLSLCHPCHPATSTTLLPHPPATLPPLPPCHLCHLCHPTTPVTLPPCHLCHLCHPSISATLPPCHALTRSVLSLCHAACQVSGPRTAGHSKAVQCLGHPTALMPLVPRLLFAASCPILHPPESPSPSPQGCSPPTHPAASAPRARGTR